MSTLEAVRHAGGSSQTQVSCLSWLSRLPGAGLRLPWSLAMARLDCSRGASLDQRLWRVEGFSRREIFLRRIVPALPRSQQLLPHSPAQQLALYGQCGLLMSARQDGRR